MTQNRETATLGGGCFWCIEAVFRQVRGVESAVSGYAAGHVKAPSYEAVCEGETGHAEVVQVTFDPAVVSYREILEIFFTVHDPTTVDRQGNDEGPQYRSIVLTHSPQQDATAKDVIADLTRQKVYDDPIVTQIEPFTELYPAEDYHQDYFAKNPWQPYCRAVVSPKVAKFRKAWAAKLKK